MKDFLFTMKSTIYKSLEENCRNIVALKRNIKLQFISLKSAKKILF